MICLSKLCDLTEQLKPGLLVFLVRELLRCTNAGQICGVTAAILSGWSREIRLMITPFIHATIIPMLVKMTKSDEKFDGVTFQVVSCDKADSKPQDKDKRSGGPRLSDAMKCKSDPSKDEPVTPKVQDDKDAFPTIAKDDKPSKFVDDIKVIGAKAQTFSDKFVDVARQIGELVWDTCKELIGPVLVVLFGGLLTLANLFPSGNCVSRWAHKLLATLKNRDFLAGGRDKTLTMSGIIDSIFNVEIFPSETPGALDYSKVLDEFRGVNALLISDPATALSDDAMWDRCAAVQARLRTIDDKTLNGVDKSQHLMLVQLVKSLEVLRSELQVEAGRRRKPVVVVLCGPPGVGKTHFLNNIVATVNAKGKVKGCDYWDCNKPNQDCLTGKSVLIMEEFGLVNMEADQKVLMGLADTRPFSPDCDQIDKKEVRLSPKLILVTTNREDIYKGFFSPAALGRRITMHVRCDRTAMTSWLVNNPGDDPTQAQLDGWFGQPLEMHVLPRIACDWTGDCYDLIGRRYQSDCVKTSEKEIMSTITDLLLKHEEEFKATVKFQANVDCPIVVVRGAPGTGKTTFTDTLGLPFVHDPHQKPGFEEFIGHCLSDDRDVVYMTCNFPDLALRVDALGPQTLSAFVRRCKFFDFSYRKKSMWSRARFEPADVHRRGWGTTVKLSHGGEAITAYVMGRMIHAVECTKKRTTVSNGTAALGRVIAKTNKDSTQFVGMTVFDIFTAVDIEDASFMPIAVTLLASQDKCSKSGSLQEMATGVTSTNTAYDGEPVSITFSNGYLTFTSEVVDGKSVLVCGHKEVVEPDATIRRKPPVQRGSTHLQELLKPALDPEVMQILTIVFTCVGTAAMAMVEMPGTRDSRPELQYRPGRMVGGKWIYDDEDDNTPRRRVIIQPDERRFDPAGPLWSEAVGTVDYSEVIDFQTGVSKCIVPLSSAQGDRVSWGFSLSSGILMNNHAVPVARKIGNMRVGPVECVKITGKDVTIVQAKLPITKSTHKQSAMVEGEEIFLVDHAGTETPYRVCGMRRVLSPNGGHYNMRLLSGPATEAGDCGLPYIRRVGREVEFLGIHSGMCGDSIMCTPWINSPEFQMVGDRTSLYRTQLPEDLCPRVYRPSPKTQPGLTTEQLERRQMDQVFTADYNDAVIDTSELADRISESAAYVECHTGQCTQWGRVQSILSMDMKTSAGPSYGCPKSEVFTPEGELRPQWRATYVARCKDIDPTCKIVLKDEMRPIEKAEVGASRVIYGYNVQETVKCKQLIGDVQAKLVRTVGDHCFSVGINNQDGSWDRTFTELKKFEHFVAADFSAWDKSVSPQLMDAAIDTLTGPIIEPVRSEARLRLKRVSRPNTQHGTPLRGLPSGMCGTSHLNCTLHLLMVNQALADMGEEPYSDNNCGIKFFCYGDDFVAGTSTKAHLDALCRVWKRWGFTATNTAKTGPPEFCAFDELEFLRRTTVTAGGMLCGALRIESVMRGLVWCRQPVPRREGVGSEVIHLPTRDMESKLQCVVGELWVHGPRVYAEQVRRIVKAFRGSGVRIPFCIPEWKRVVMRAHFGEDGESVITDSSVDFQMDTKTDAAAPAQGEVVMGDGVAGMASVAAPTVGMEMAQGTTGGEVSVDPAIYTRWATTETAVFSLTTVMRPGTILYQQRIHPTANMYTNHLSLMYNSWGGSFDFGLFMTHNAFVGGQLAAVFLPPGIDPADYSLAQLLSFDHQILDIMTMSGVILTASDIKNVLWHRMTDTSTTGYGGTFVVVLANEVIYAGDAATSLMVRVMSRPSANFAFSMLMPPRGLTQDVAQEGSSYALMMAVPGSSPVFNADINGFVIMSQSSSAGSRTMSEAIVASDGTDNITGVRLRTGKTQTVQCVVARVEATAGSYIINMVGPDGAIWDPTSSVTGLDGLTGSAPPQLGIRYHGDNRVMYCFSEEGDVGFSSNQANIQLSGTAGNQSWILTGAHVGWPLGQPVYLTFQVNETIAGIGPVPPLNPGESLCGYIGLTHQVPQFEYQTAALGAGLSVLPVPEGCPLFTHSSNGVPTGAEVKLTSTGHLVSGGIATTTIYEGFNEFRYVGVVSPNYIPRGPTTSAGLRISDERETLRRCLALLSRARLGELSEDSAVLLAGLPDRRLPTRVHGTANSRVRRTIAACFPGGTQHSPAQGSAVQPGTSEEDPGRAGQCSGMPRLRRI
uniref:Polyprotein n=1 Tax=Wenling rattails calicivirus 3 TaxID=2116390 RepID=A0A2P1GML1_9CALI|nr:polyprotein [Wenling rattails calicivirus 3]